MWDEEITYDQNQIKEAKMDFTKVGFALALSIIVALAVSYALLYGVPALLGKDSPLVKSKYWIWFIAFAPMYLIAFPLAGVVFRTIDRTPLRQKKLPVSKFFMFLLICFPLMVGGSVIGNILGMLLSQGEAENVVTDIVLDDSFMKALVVVILAPIVEELVFRKCIIDRTVKYGEKTAVILSAVTFGLYHMNIFQIFYAFAVGLIFAYVYVITGKIIYSIMLHIIINFQGGVLGPWILEKSKLGIADLRAMSDKELVSSVGQNPELSYLIIYSLFIFALAIGGAVILFKNKKRFTFVSKRDQLPDDKKLVFSTVYMNVGMSLFLAICIFRIVYALV